MNKISVAIKEPLAPQVLKQAGVPLNDALWFNGLPSQREKMQVLATPRGERVLGYVRKFMAQATAYEAIPTS